MKIIAMMMLVGRQQSQTACKNPSVIPRSSIFGNPFQAGEGSVNSQLYRLKVILLVSNKTTTATTIYNKLALLPLLQMSFYQVRMRNESVAYLPVISSFHLLQSISSFLFKCRLVRSFSTATLSVVCHFYLD